jgi:hypothetical protein
MSLFSKVVALLILVAGGVLFFFAGADWAKRAQWADATRQVELLLNGLPVDAQETDVQGVPKVADLREPLLKSLFSKSGGSPVAGVVKTQTDEVDLVKRKLEEYVNAAPDRAGQVKELAGIMLALAETSTDRERYLQLIDKPAEDQFDPLQSEFNEAFRKAKTAAAPSGGKEPGQDVRREAIAHLLFRVADVLWQKENPQPPSLLESKTYDRLLTVVGLEALAGEVDHRAAQLQTAAADVRAALDRDRNTFLDSQRRQLQVLMDTADELDRQRGLLKTQSDLVADAKKAVALRQADHERLNTDWENAKKLTRQKIDSQMKMEQELFKSRQELRDAYAANQELEQTIRALEQKLPSPR